jgi:multidrug resistance efflux pump
VPTQHPRLRPDLVVSRQQTPEGPSYVLKQPGTRRFFRLREAEYAVARRLDGETPLEGVADQVASELGVEPAADVVAAFVEQLRKGGLLEGPGGAPAADARRPLIQGDLLWLRFRAFDPDRLLDRLVRTVRFGFTPAFLISGVALIAWAFATVLVHREELQSDLAQLWDVRMLLLAWVAVITVTTLHEFAHGLTCKHFGGHVHEMGFLLIYLQPAFFCNISDAWLFPEKSKRMWVAFAGSFFETILWALATLVWRLTERDTWASHAALVVVATSGIKLFLNMNPLIKLDGYYLLSDWLDIPNLRQRSFQYVGHGIRRMLGAGAARAAPDLAPRERRALLAYGLLATTFSCWLLSAVLVRFAAYFTDRWRGWGVVLWAGLLVGVVGNVTGKRLFRWPAALSPASHRGRALLACGAIVLFLYLVPLELRVGGELGVAPARNTDIRAQVAGIIDAVYVDEGQKVAAGDTLARLIDRDVEARLKMTEAELAENQAKLRLLEAGPRVEELQVARLSVAKTEAHLRYARADLQRNRDLAATEAGSRKELEQAEEQVSVLTTELAGERAQLQMLVAGSRPDELTAMREEVAHSEAELSHLQGELARTWVTAPHGGIVVTPKLRERIGEFVKPGDLIGEVYALETVTAEIAVPEQDIGDVQVGRSGSVRLRAYPERSFEGRVIAIAASAVEPQGQRGRFVKATIELPNPAGLLKPSMTGYARISCGRRRALDVLTRSLRRFLRVEFWSWW